MTWVIAHRGASADEKENTLPAFERAIEVGADYVEFDVQASSDGCLVASTTSGSTVSPRPGGHFACVLWPSSRNSEFRH